MKKILVLCVCAIMIFASVQVFAKESVTDEPVENEAIETEIVEYNKESETASVVTDLSNDSYSETVNELLADENITTVKVYDRNLMNDGNIQ